MGDSAAAVQHQRWEPWRLKIIWSTGAVPQSPLMSLKCAWNVGAATDALLFRMRFARFLSLPSGQCPTYPECLDCNIEIGVVIGTQKADILLFSHCVSFPFAAPRRSAFAQSSSASLSSHQQRHLLFKSNQLSFHATQRCCLRPPIPRHRGYRRWSRSPGYRCRR